MASTIVPEAADRPSVLPSERLLANGMAVPALRADLRRIKTRAMPLRPPSGSGWRSSSEAPCGSTSGGATWWRSCSWGRCTPRFAILMHEVVHKLLFTNKRWNDWIGKWVVAYPVFTPVQLYRRVHFATTRTSSAPTSPTSRSTPLPLHAAGAVAPPVPRRSRHQRVEELRAAGQEHPRASRSAPSACPSSGSRPFSGRHRAATGRWWIYPLLSFLPWMTEWRVINRLRSIAEHGGMERSPDRRATTHNVRQSLLARFWIVP